MRKALTVLALTAALTGGGATAAFAADATSTSPHQLTQPRAVNTDTTTTKSDKTGLYGLLGLLGLAGLVKRKDNSASSSR
jgi:hypothetical protein